MPLVEAVQTFGHGFACLRSYTYPFEFAQVGDGIWVLRDAPLRLKDGRSMEYIPVSVPPQRAIADLKRIVSKHPSPTKPRESAIRWAVSAVDPSGSDFDAIRAAYKAAGFRYLRKEAMMARSLNGEITAFECPFPIRRTATQDDVD